jgi:zinc/manganese transport system substrate-binding protein
MRVILLFLVAFSTLFAKMQVSVAYPYIEQLTKIIAKDKVSITILSRGDWDPHFVVPKPSLVAKLRDSDLLIINGASLEIGWLPPLIKSAHNTKIQKGAKGHLDLSTFVKLQDIPGHVDRSMGHVHEEGNPHFALDPHRIIPLAEVIMLTLSLHDEKNYAFYKKNFEFFKAHWHKKLNVYDNKMKKCKGMKVVQYHELFNYFLRRYDIESLDNLEPIPGIKPNSKHALKLINEIRDNDVKLILQDVYHEHKTASFIAEKTGAKVVELPHDVGAVKGTQTLDLFYDTLVGRVCN